MFKNMSTKYLNFLNGSSTENHIDSIKDHIMDLEQSTNEYDSLKHISKLIYY